MGLHILSLLEARPQKDVCLFVCLFVCVQSICCCELLVSATRVVRVSLSSGHGAEGWRSGGSEAHQAAGAHTARVSVFGRRKAPKRWGFLWFFKGNQDEKGTLTKAPQYLPFVFSIVFWVHFRTWASLEMQLLDVASPPETMWVARFLLW